MKIYRHKIFGSQITLTVRPAERKPNPRCTRSMGQQLRMAAMRVHACLTRENIERKIGEQLDD